MLLSGVNNLMNWNFNVISISKQHPHQIIETVGGYRTRHFLGNTYYIGAMCE